MEVSGGGLGATYSTLQFHFHWGNTEHHPGSEHLVDGMRYAMEVEHRACRRHPFWNSKRMKNSDDSLVKREYNYRKSSDANSDNKGVSVCVCVHVCVWRG